MFNDDSLEKHEQKIQELELENERLRLKMEKYFFDLGVTPEEVNAFMNNSANFSDDTWEKLQYCRQTLDEKLTLDLKNIRNVKKAKKSYSDLNLPSYAIFVR